MILVSNGVDRNALKALSPFCGVCGLCFLVKTAGRSCYEQDCGWLKPELVAQIEFTEWAPDGHLRHSKFVGVREVKDPRKICESYEAAQ